MRIVAVLCVLASLFGSTLLAYAMGQERYGDAVGLAMSAFAFVANAVTFNLNYKTDQLRKRREEMMKYFRDRSPYADRGV